MADVQHPPTGMNGWPATPGPARLWSEPVLVVGQRPAAVGFTLDYPIWDASGKRVGSLTDVGRRDLSDALRPERLADGATGTARGGLVDALRQLSANGRDVPYRLRICDPNGAPLIVLTASGWERRSQLSVTDPDGREIGQVVREGGLGKPRFALLVRGERVAAVMAEQWWTVGHRVIDRYGEELAQVTPSRQGWLSKGRRAKSASFMVEVRRRLDEPLRSLVLAVTIGADTALKQPEPTSITGGG